MKTKLSSQQIKALRKAETAAKNNYPINYTSANSRTLASLVKNGYLHEDVYDFKYWLTDVGREALEATRHVNCW